MLQIDTYLCIRAVLLCTFFVIFFKLKDNLQKTSCHDLKNQQKSVPSTVPESLAYTLIHLGAFRSAEARFHSKNLIRPYFSSLSMVAISVRSTSNEKHDGHNNWLGPCSVSSVMAHNGVMKAPYIVWPIIALQIQYKYSVNIVQIRCKYSVSTIQIQYKYSTKVNLIQCEVNAFLVMKMPNIAWSIVY